MGSRDDSGDLGLDRSETTHLEEAIDEPIEDRDDSWLPEEDRDLTPEEQVEELKSMLREGRIGIHAVGVSPAAELTPNGSTRFAFTPLCTPPPEVLLNPWLAAVRQDAH